MSIASHVRKSDPTFQRERMLWARRWIFRSFMTFFPELMHVGCQKFPATFVRTNSAHSPRCTRSRRHFHSPPRGLTLRYPVHHDGGGLSQKEDSLCSQEFSSPHSTETILIADLSVHTLSPYSD